MLALTRCATGSTAARASATGNVNSMLAPTPTTAAKAMAAGAVGASAPPAAPSTNRASATPSTLSRLRRLIQAAQAPTAKSKRTNPSTLPLWRLRWSSGPVAATIAARPATRMAIRSGGSRRAIEGLKSAPTVRHDARGRRLRAECRALGQAVDQLAPVALPGQDGGAADHFDQGHEHQAGRPGRRRGDGVGSAEVGNGRTSAVGGVDLEGHPAADADDP